MRTLSEKLCLKHVEKELGLEEGITEIKKEFVYLQGHKSEVLVICSITIESERMDAKLMGMEWNPCKTSILKKKTVR